MAAIYLQKFNVAGEGLISRVASDHRRIWLFLEPWKALRSGFERLWALTTVFVVAMLAYRPRRLFPALVAMLSIVALLLHVEAALIMPIFTIMYHNFTVFYLAVMGIVAAQLAVNALFAPAVRARAGRLTAAPRQDAAVTAAEHVDAH
jgi:hypothetical protein